MQYKFLIECYYEGKHLQQNHSYDTLGDNLQYPYKEIAKDMYLRVITMEIINNVISQSRKLIFQMHFYLFASF